MTTTTPHRSLEQKLDALDQANRVRTARAHLKRCLRTNPQDAHHVIANPTTDFRSMRLIDLLLAMPKLGEYRVTRFLTAEHISPLKTLAGLSDRQRTATLRFVDQHTQTIQKAA